MDYDLYFHNDLDGIASAAILSSYLESRGHQIINYRALNYPVNLKNWSGTKFKKPTAIVDFIYHPKAAIWFDHHETSFINEGWRKNFSKHPFCFWDSKMPSCARLVLKILTEKFNFKSRTFLRNLVQEADVIDAARFASVQQAFSFNSPTIQIVSSLEESPPRGYQKFLIQALTRQPLEKVAKLPLVQKYFKKHEQKFRKSFLIFKKRILVYKKVAFIDASGKNLVGARFVSFLLYPKIYYAVRIEKSANVFKLGVGSNPWHRPKTKVHIGEFLRKNYGGGGHRAVGATNFKTKKRALKAAREIINYLNTNG